MSGPFPPPTMPVPPFPRGLALLLTAVVVAGMVLVVFGPQLLVEVQKKPTGPAPPGPTCSLADLRIYLGPTATTIANCAIGNVTIIFCYSTSSLTLSGNTFLGNNTEVPYPAAGWGC